jgi:diaminopimelate epimerase
MELPFTKYQALGNDFLVIDAREDEDLVDDAQLAVTLLDRRRGVGADDVIFVIRSARADLGMRIRSPSGGWLSMCGNGLRCLARYAHDHNLASSDALSVETDAGVRQTRWLGGPEELIVADLSEPDLRAAAIPTSLAAPGDEVLQRPLELGSLGRPLVSCVSVGNPHAIVFVDDLAAIDMAALGAAIEHHPAFPQGVNVHAAQVCSPHLARIRTWERGAGLTLA